MATREDLENALVKAHNSGDFEAASLFASMIKGGEFGPEATALGTLGETLKGVPRGVANSLISTGEGLFQLADAGLNLVGLEDVIDDEDEDSVLNLARQGREALNESFLGVGQGYQDSFGTKFGEGLGSFFTFLGPGLIGKAAGLTGKALTASQLWRSWNSCRWRGSWRSISAHRCSPAGYRCKPREQKMRLSLLARLSAQQSYSPVDRLFKGLYTRSGQAVSTKSIMPRLVIMRSRQAQVLKPFRKLLQDRSRLHRSLRTSMTPTRPSASLVG
jgi:hypothetical protein